ADAADERAALVDVVGGRRLVAHVRRLLPGQVDATLAGVGDQGLGRRGLEGHGRHERVPGALGVDERTGDLPVAVHPPGTAFVVLAGNVDRGRLTVAPHV